MSGRRYHRYLCRRYRVLGRYLGFLLLLLGVIQLLPLLLLFWYPADWPLAGGFVLPAAALLCVGGWLRRIEPGLEASELSLAEGSQLVVLAWLAAIMAGSIPFRWSGLSFHQALFEVTSGWTTTGLSVVDVANSPALILFYRSLLQLLGGAGLAILLVSLLLINSGVGLSSAEGHSEQLVPQVRQSARLVLRLYAGYVLFGIGALKVTGMGWFDALNHAFCALSTGGFSTHAEPLAEWTNRPTQLVLMLLMVLGMTNFLTAYSLSQRRWRALWYSSELRLTLVVLLLAGLFWWRMSASETGLTALFHLLSALSTTGFAITEPRLLAPAGWLLLLLLMLIGGGSGSTAGGIKQQRIVQLLKSCSAMLRQVFLSPHRLQIDTLWIGDQKRSVLIQDIARAGSYLFLYLVTWLTGSLLLTGFGYPLAESLFEFASSLGTVGLSLGLTSASAPALQLWLQMFAMLLGRLEFIVLFWGLAKLLSDLRCLSFSADKIGLTND